MLRPLQRLLETIYDAPCGHDVRDFLLTQRHQLPVSRREAASDEELVLIEHPQESRLGLYIDAAVLERLESHNPLQGLDAGNLADFWTALEGVSHFSYLMWNAGHQRGVSQLELELQAEVDKYVASWWLLRRQHPEHQPRELHYLLFGCTRVDASMDAPRQDLYTAASRQAARFCSRLESALASNRPVLRRAAVAALRRFYRLGSTRKLQHIDSMMNRSLATAAI
ncbi:MAG TPA: hypothetical protein VEQ17_08725 [Steroidobacteraceae bacterium]|nr:hypothetical protein [Steroidobacteraceae bacterium]